MTTTDPPLTQRAVWNWLRVNGPAKPSEITEALFPDTVCDECGRGGYAFDEATEEVNAIIRKLNHTGHISSTPDWKWDANETDDLHLPTSPFDVGGPVSGDAPPDEP